MALPTTNIFLRSPYIIEKSVAELDYVKVNLKIWNGLLSDEPNDITIRLRSTALDDYVSIDIAEFARDYVEVTFGGTEDSSAVFVSYQMAWVTQSGVETPDPKVYLIGFDGYSAFQEGVNFQFYNDVLMSSNVVTAYEGVATSVPVLTGHLTGWDLYKYGNSDIPTYIFYTGTVTPVATLPDTSISTEDLVRYVSTANGGVYADRVVFHFDNAPDETVDVEYVNCNKYGNTKLHFVNKYGTIQQMHLSGRFDVGVKTESSDFKRNLLVNGSYSTTRHQKSTLNKNGIITMELNSGWYSQEDNDTFLEMLMSEQVWIEVEVARLGLGWLPKQAASYTIPVNCTSNTMQLKNKINHKLINYTFKFEAAHDWINTVR